LSRVARFREAKRGDTLKERSGIAALGGSADDFARAVEGPWLRKKMARAGKRLKISLSGAPGKGEILKRLIKLVVPAALLMSACGATVGDACTTASDCGNQLCINQAWTLGGYCSKPCTTGDDSTCPSGSTCIAGGNGANSPACFRLCSTSKDCRSGYVCEQSRTNPKLICIGPADGI